MTVDPIPLASLDPAPTTWLWPGRIPAAGLTLLVGEADEGKSTIACDLAARLSRPLLDWPDKQPITEAGDTLYCCVEDSLAETLIPRLDAAEADRLHIFACTRFDDGTITRAITSSRFRLIVLDPFSAFFPTSKRETATRANLQLLSSLSREHSVAILAILHLTKSTGRTLHRVLGSVAMTAIPRSVLCVQRYFFDDLRTLSSIKHNLTGAQEHIPYTFMTDPQTGAPRIRWDRPILVAS